MKNLLLPLIVGGAVVLLASQKSESKSKTDKSTNEELSIPVSKYTPPKQGTLIPLGPQTCGLLQYWDEKLGMCVDFWKEGETDQLVKERLLLETKKIYNKPDLGEKRIDSLCDDIWEGDEEKIVGTWVANPNMINIVKNVIISLWPTVTKDALPPKETSPEWLRTIWIKTIQTYSEVICKN